MEKKNLNQMSRTKLKQKKLEDNLEFQMTRQMCHNKCLLTMIKKIQKTFVDVLFREKQHNNRLSRIVLCKCSVG